MLWALAPALVHDSSHFHYIQQRSLARDTLLLDTMELREKAIAVHVHHPTKFTIDYKGPVVDIRKVWASAVKKVDEVGEPSRWVCCCLGLVELWSSAAKSRYMLVISFAGWLAACFC